MFNYRNYWVAALATAVLFSLGCSEDPSGDGSSTGKTSHGLQKLESCDELGTYIREAAIENLALQIETQKAEIESCWSGGQGYDDTAADSGWSDDAEGRPSAGEGEGESNGGGDGADGGGGTHSVTNTQEKDVDEGDIVKTDGQHLYVLSNTGDLVIVGTTDGQLEEIGRLDILGRASEMYLREGTAVVFSALDRSQVPEEIQIYYPMNDDGGSSGSSSTEPGMPGEPGDEPDIDTGIGSSDGEESEPNPTDTEMAEDDAPPSEDMVPYYYGGESYTRITLINVSNPADPTIIREVTYAGEYVSSRMVDNALRVVVSSPTPVLDAMAQLDTWSYCELGELVGRPVMEAAFDALFEATSTIINETPIDQIMPKKIEVGQSAESIVECDQVYGPLTPAGTGILSVVSIDLDTPESGQTDIAIIGEKGLVYASSTSLYLTTSRDYVEAAVAMGQWTNETSGIHKFDISTNASTTVYKATGTVEGRMLNQFCLGEKDGFLRVATTTGDSWNPATLDNHITVFEEQDGKLEQTAIISGIGEEEEIYAARFLGDRGFLVTFYNTDPLFTFDLSDPFDPKVVGEWQGPGYSSYLHPWGDDKIIAMGEDNGVVISLYDISDFAHPTMIEREQLSDNNEGYAYSEAVNDHKAFQFNSETGLLAIPFGGWDYEYDTKTTGIAMFQLSDSGIERTDSLLLGDADSQYGYNEPDASRSVFIDDLVFGLSRCRVVSAALSDPSTAIDTIALYSGEYCDDYYDEGGVDGGWEDTDWEDEGDWPDEGPDVDTATEPEPDPAGQ